MSLFSRISKAWNRLTKGKEAERSLPQPPSTKRAPRKWFQRPPSTGRTPQRPPSTRKRLPRPKRVIPKVLPPTTKRLEDMTFEELLPDTIDAGSLLEKPDINRYIHDYEPEWLEAWEGAPVEEMSDAQIQAFINMLEDISFDDWPDFDDGFDFWEWYRETYNDA